ncbi:peptide chain release factor 2 [Pyramidobacter sp. SM-530-WT-4B]|uniref:Peptide chain release factor 2 n=1 Tax=Pyramidobacter porci TaxID=2605789 RepID=A0A6L5YBW4_9BACT|nr:peptide chain release factor 2 [Pyramidobacter porci]
MPSIRKDCEELRAKTAAPGFWSGADAQKISAQLSRHEADLARWEKIEREFADLQTMAELLGDGEDAELLQEFGERSAAFRRQIEDEQMALLLSGPYDHCSAILSVHAGSGGLDSQDWAEMLYRMYLRWCEERRFKTKLLDYQHDEEAGIKSATLLIQGETAYGYLRSEIGVHRLVRISPFDTNKRRHTSFASVDVSPQLPDDVDVAIAPEDLRIDTYRSSGAGGQHVNMTDSAVRVTHLPTGIVVSCQNERSQHMNKATAMSVLKSKLYQRELEQRQAEMNALAGEKKESTWGSQIRSYVLQPYTLVKDHRTGEETGNVGGVLDGGLDPFILAYLRWAR